MTASAAESSPPPSTITMDIPDVEYIVPPPGYEDDMAASPESQKSQRIFKKHRVLPHPRNGSGGFSGAPDSRRASSGSQRYYEDSHSDLQDNKSRSHVASHHTLRHQRRRISGGDLPPTPPAHSRTSSSSHSVNISIPSPLQTPAQSSEDVPSNTNPSTPPNQRSPPTPDVTPPQPITTSRPKPPTLRPTLYERLPSKATTDSRSESFRTARESPVSDEEDERSTLRPAPISTRTSQVTVRQTTGNGSEHKNSQSRLGVGLGLGLDTGLGDDQAELTPKSRGGFPSFDREWGSGSEVEQEWEGDLTRNVTGSKVRSSKQTNGREREVVDDLSVSPTNATKALRGIPLHGRILTYDSPEPSRSFTAPEAAHAEAVNTEAAIDADIRRFSGMSSRSAASTIVEAFLVETPPRQQRRTLRHVKRVDALRDSIWRQSPPLSSGPTINGARSRRHFGDQLKDAPRESYASNATASSVSSHKARREVWKNGGVPVVVVPDRLSSNRSSSQEHSLRSTSSKRSKRSQSLASVPPEQLPNGHDSTSYFDRPPGRSRMLSESDGSTPGDQRTIDFPPVVPRRTSSLSASGSYNGSHSQSKDPSLNESRAESLTAESLKAHNAMQAKLVNGVSPVPSVGAASHTAEQPSSSHSSGQADLPVVTVHTAPSLEHPQPVREQQRSEGQQQHLESGDPLVSKTTPFSQASVDTSGTSAADIGEARAVSMVPHKIESVVMVNHRLSESPVGDQRRPDTAKPDRPTITTTGVTGVTEVHEVNPTTPSQARPSLDDIDSPLRNPRMPPEPPAIQFIPATPSGLTPAEEKSKMLGNFYEELEEEPTRTPSVVRRALSRRRRSSRETSPVRKNLPSLLTRTFSLRRNYRKETFEDSDSDYAVSDDGSEDIDETRLHPDWRPSYYPDDYDDDDDGAYDLDDEEHESRGYYAADDYPSRPRRSLSDRMKRTFAIMPLQDVYDRDGGPDRRTVKRTSSGNLRVVKKLGSVGSLQNKKDRRPSIAPDEGRRPFWSRSNSVRSQNRHDGVPEKAKADRTEPPRTSQTRRWSMSQNIGSLTRRLSEKRREKRSNELRQKIGRPHEVRDGVGDVIRREAFRDAFTRPRRMREDIHGE